VFFLSSFKLYFTIRPRTLSSTFFQFTTMNNCRPVIRRYVIWVTDGVVKRTIGCNYNDILVWLECLKSGNKLPAKNLCVICLRKHRWVHVCLLVFLPTGVYLSSEIVTGFRIN
jgi:hypothetical protein